MGVVVAAGAIAASGTTSQAGAEDWALKFFAKQRSKPAKQPTTSTAGLDAGLVPLPVRKPRRAARALPVSVTAYARDPVAAASDPADQWSPAEILLAKTRCEAALKSIDAVAVPAAPIKSGECGDPAPVTLMSIGRSPAVALSPAPTVNCDMVVALHTWLQDHLQPSARRLLGAPITKINAMSSYSCRNAYGRTNTRLSEHGRANALDIGFFETAGRQKVSLLQHWGPTERDIIAANKAREAAEAAKLAAARETEAAGERERTDEAAATATPAAGRPLSSAAARALAEVTPANDQRRTNTAVAPDPVPGLRRTLGAIVDTLPTLGGQAGGSPEADNALSHSGPSRLGGPRAPADGKRQFLRDAHSSACVVFMTVLGPEANNAHRNHFHVDMAKRRSGAYCE